MTYVIIFWIFVFILYLALAWVPLFDYCILGSISREVAKRKIILRHLLILLIFVFGKILLWFGLAL